MEFEDVSEEVKREARRVAAAFRLKEYTVENRFEENEFKLFFTSEIDIEVCVHRQAINMVCIYKHGPPGLPQGYFCEVFTIHTADDWTVLENGRDVCDLMARGLYCLGIEDERVTNQLPALTAHEKMELRLSLPREFWPKTWLDEEAAND